MLNDLIINKIQKNRNAAREMAASILSQVELYGEFYYTIEDWLTEMLLGNYHDLPKGTQGEYLKCALRIEVRDFFDASDIEDIESEDIEKCVDIIFNHNTRNVLDMEFIRDVVNEYLYKEKGIKNV